MIQISKLAEYLLLNKSKSFSKMPKGKFYLIFNKDKNAFWNGEIWTQKDLLPIKDYLTAIKEKNRLRFLTKDRIYFMKFFFNKQGYPIIILPTNEPRDHYKYLEE